MSDKPKNNQPSSGRTSRSNDQQMELLLRHRESGKVVAFPSRTPDVAKSAGAADAKRLLLDFASRLPD